MTPFLKTCLHLCLLIAHVEVAGAFLARALLNPQAALFTLKSAPREIFIVSFDGVVAKDVEWRVRLGIQAAGQTWPHLLDIMTEDSEWLCNKMMALSHAMEERAVTSLTCEYALLARMLLEEQELDQERSVGLNGKYASKFHPSGSTSERRKAERKNGSRPLTVGEISANWTDGACLRDTLILKYNMDGRSPLPILQAVVEELQCDALPVVNALVCEALSKSIGNVIVTVGHESEIEILENTLKDTPLGSVKNLCSAKVSESQISFIQSSETSAIRQVLIEAPKDSTVYVIHGCWKTLKKAKSLFGDNMPRGASLARAAIGNSVKLSLNLPDWVGSPGQQNDVEMDPWMALISENQFAELVSARIVTDQ